MLYARYFSTKDMNNLKVKGGNVYSMQMITKRAKMAILVLDKIDLRSKIVTRDTGGQYIMIKESVHQEAIMIINI